jgi:hypothetical protein
MPTRRVPDELPDLEDEELDLPPPDADADEGDEGEAEGDLDDVLDEGGLDDAEAADLDVGGDELETDDDEGEDGDGEIDVGAIDEGIVVDEAAADASETEGAADDDGLALDDTGSEDDGGAEGTNEDPGDEVDESALPELDDDDGAEGDDALAETLLAETEATIPWASARWAVLEGAGAALPCRAVAAAAGRVAAAGEVLLAIEEGARAARRLSFGEGSIAVALGDDALLAATARGQLLYARDGGADATAIGSWRAGVEPSLGLRPIEGGSAVELAATPGRFWIRAGAALLCSTSPAQPLAAVRERGVLAITASAGVLVALTSGAAGTAIERFRGDDEGWAETPLAGEPLHIAGRDRSALARWSRDRAGAAGALCLAAAAGGRAVALGDQQRVAVSRDGGAAFTTLDLGAAPAIAFAGDDADAPLLVLTAPPGSATAILVEIDASGSALRIGEIAAPEREAGAGSPWATAALAWDAAREIVWIASGAGLVALGRPRRH